MAKRRSSMRGKGADIFLGSEGKEQEEARPQGKPPLQPNQKATFYFPPEVLERLDKVWLELRQANRDVKKSDLVATALSAALKEHAENPEGSVLAELLTS